MIERSEAVDRATGGTATRRQRMSAVVICVSGDGQYYDNTLRFAGKAE
jgi:hypothetical protein